MVFEEKVIILANKRSRGYRDAYRRHLLNVFARRRQAPIYYLPAENDMFSSLHNEIKFAKHVIIAGGDGTFESALNDRQLQKKSLGFFPLGAGNSFYSYFYKGKRFEYLRSQFQFRDMDIDVLELQLENKNLQTLFLSIGIDAEVIRLAKERTYYGFSDYVAASWNALWKGRASFKLECFVDGVRHFWNNCINITLGKIPYYGFGMRSLLGKLQPDDGMIYGLLYNSAHHPRWNKLLRLWGLVLAALGLRWTPLFPFRGKEIIVQSKEPFPVQAGGEFLGYSRHVKVVVKRKQKVLVI